MTDDTMTLADGRVMYRVASSFGAAWIFDDEPPREAAPIAGAATVEEMTAAVTGRHPKTTEMFLGQLVQRRIRAALVLLEQLPPGVSGACTECDGAQDPGPCTARWGQDPSYEYGDELLVAARYWCDACVAECLADN